MLTATLCDDLLRSVINKIALNALEHSRKICTFGNLSESCITCLCVCVCKKQTMTKTETKKILQFDCDIDRELLSFFCDRQLFTARLELSTFLRS